MEEKRVDSKFSQGSEKELLAEVQSWVTFAGAAAISIVITLDFLQAFVRIHTIAPIG